MISLLVTNFLYCFGTWLHYGIICDLGIPQLTDVYIHISWTVEADRVIRKELTLQYITLVYRLNLCRQNEAIKTTTSQLS